jgi:hypothetical protein
MYRAAVLPRDGGADTRVVARFWHLSGIRSHCWHLQVSLVNDACAPAVVRVADAGRAPAVLPIHVLRRRQIDARWAKETGFLPRSATIFDGKHQSYRILLNFYQVPHLPSWSRAVMNAIFQVVLDQMNGQGVRANLTTSLQYFVARQRRVRRACIVIASRPQACDQHVGGSVGPGFRQLCADVDCRQVLCIASHRWQAGQDDRTGPLQLQGLLTSWVAARSQHARTAPREPRPCCLQNLELRYVSPNCVQLQSF